MEVLGKFQIFANFFKILLGFTYLLQGSNVVDVPFIATEPTALSFYRRKQIQCPKREQIVMYYEFFWFLI